MFYTIFTLGIWWYVLLGAPYGQLLLRHGELAQAFTHTPSTYANSFSVIQYPFLDGNGSEKFVPVFFLLLQTTLINNAD
jgi:hypothetical protein